MDYQRTVGRSALAYLHRGLEPGMCEFSSASLAEWPLSELPFSFLLYSRCDPLLIHYNRVVRGKQKLVTLSASMVLDNRSPFGLFKSSFRCCGLFPFLGRLLCISF